MLSIVITHLLAGASAALVAAPPMMKTAPAEAVSNRFECGVCGGAVGGCPNCMGPAPAVTFNLPFGTFSGFDLLTEEKSEPAARFECGVCGGAPDGCPNCMAPSPSVTFSAPLVGFGFELFEAPTFDIPKKSEPAASFECGVCGGAAGGCPNCGGYSTAAPTRRTAVRLSAPLMMSVPGFECGVCGGAAGGCPNCGGGCSASLVTAAANPGFECGACGGAAGGCPNCGGYSA